MFTKILNVALGNTEHIKERKSRSRFIETPHMASYGNNVVYRAAYAP